MYAKITRPRVSAIYCRSRLFDRLDRTREQHSVTFIDGPPGAGKTALLASYVASKKLRCLWYQIDSGDDDIATFFQYMSHAAQPHLRADAAAPPAFDSSAGDLIRFSRRYFRELYAGLDSPLFLVFDNYAELASDSPVHQAIRIACEEKGDEHHIAIASRDAFPSALAHMHCNHLLAIVAAHELLLTLEEARGVVESYGIVAMPPAASQALHERSAGWVMGMMLMLDPASPEATANDQNVCARNGREKSAFDYFAREVFAKLHCDARDLLLRAALLPTMTIRRVAALTGTSQTGALLLELERRNHFVSRLPGEESAFQFHPQFRQFLLHQCRERFTVAKLSVEQSKAAEILIAEGDAEASIRLFEEAWNWQRMVEVIVEAAPGLIERGHAERVAACVDKLHSDIIDANPWLFYLRASSRLSPDRASLEKAYRQFRAVNDLRGMASSWAQLIETAMGAEPDFAAIDLWMGEFEARLEQRLAQLPPAPCARLTLAYFFALALCEPLHPKLTVWRDTVSRLLDSGNRTADRAVVRHHLATYHIWRGQHAEAEAVLSMLFDADHSQGAEQPLRTLVDHVTEAMVALHLGAHERCLRAVWQGLRVAHQSGGHHVFEAELLYHGAMLNLNRGDLAQSDEFLVAYARLAETVPAVDPARYYAAAAWRRFHGNEPKIALQLLARSVAAAEANRTPYIVAADHLGFALLFHLCGETSEGLRHLELGRIAGDGIGNSLIEYVYHLFGAYIALESGDEDGARRLLSVAMRLGRQHGYMHFLVFPRRIIARLCLLAIAAEIETSYVRSLIERNELTPDPAWQLTESWPWRLRIYTLGRFGVVKEGTALRFTGKAQKKPLELLKALIAFGGRDVSEVKLADALWPEAEGDAASRSLATTLCRLRKLIGEDVIRRQEGRLTLEPTLCWVDCWAFERLSIDSEGDFRAHLHKMHKLHQGAFLSGMDDVPWAQPMRERLRARLARLEALIGRRNSGGGSFESPTLVLEFK